MSIYELIVKANKEPENIDKYIQYIAQLQDSEAPFYFAKEVKNLTEKQVEDLAIMVTSPLVDGKFNIGNLNTAFYFAQQVKNAPLRLIASAFVQAGDLEYIYRFALEIENAPIDILVKPVIASKDSFEIKRFASQIEGAPIYELAMAMLETSDITQIYAFAKDIPDAPKEELIKGLIKKGDVKYSLMIAEEFFLMNEFVAEVVNTADVELIEKATNQISNKEIKEFLSDILRTLKLQEEAEREI